jgi:hypothetical protein
MNAGPHGAWARAQAPTTTSSTIVRERDHA